MISLYEFLVKDKSKIDKMEFVDLELPSGTLWAKYNLGSNDEMDPGLFFQFGQLKGVKSIDEFIPEDDYRVWLRKHYPNSNDILKPEDDAAKKMLGDKCHIPTPDDIEELLDNVTIEDNKRNKIILKSIHNKNYLVFPIVPMYYSYGNRWSADKGVHILSTHRQHADEVIMLAKGYLSDSVGIGSNYCRNGSNIRAIKNK